MWWYSNRYLIKEKKLEKLMKEVEYQKTRRDETLANERLRGIHSGV